MIAFGFLPLLSGEEKSYHLAPQSSLQQASEIFHPSDISEGTRLTNYFKTLRTIRQDFMGLKIRYFEAMQRYLALHKEIQNQKIHFSSRGSFQISGLCWKMEQTDGKLEAGAPLGIILKAENGETFLLREKEKDYNPPYLQIESYGHFNLMYGLHINMGFSIPRTDPEWFALGTTVFQKYGGTFPPLPSQPHPETSFDFSSPHLTHYIETPFPTPKSPQIDSPSIAETLFHTGLTSASINENPAGATQHSWAVSTHYQKGFGTWKNDFVLLLDIGIAREKGADLTIDPGNLGQYSAQEMESLGIKLSPIPESDLHEVQSKNGHIAREAVKGFKINKKKYYLKLISLMTEGRIPPLPIYDIDTQKLLNGSFLKKFSTFSTPHAKAEKIKTRASVLRLPGRSS